MGAAQRGTVDFWLGVLMVALAITGTTLSRRVLEKLTDASFRQWTRWTVMTTGVVYLVDGRLAARPVRRAPAAGRSSDRRFHR